MTLKRKSILKNKTRLKSKKLLKSNTKLKSKTKLSSGNRTKKWDELKIDLKNHFKNVLKITNCEAKLDGCWVNNGLTFAHAKKRRYIEDNELGNVILCCIHCHTLIEQYPHSEMQSFVETAINNRKIK